MKEMFKDAIHFKQWQSLEAWSRFGISVTKTRNNKTLTKAIVMTNVICTLIAGYRISNSYLVGVAN